MCEHSEEHVISHCSNYMHWFTLVPVWWNIHSLLTEAIVFIKMDGIATPTGKVLYCEREIGNRSDPCAVIVKKCYPLRYLIIQFYFWWSQIATNSSTLRWRSSGSCGNRSHLIPKPYFDHKCNLYCISTQKSCVR